MKKTIFAVLSCVVCLYMLSVYSIPSQAAACYSNHVSIRNESFGGYRGESRGHMTMVHYVESCGLCGAILATGTIYGEYEGHVWTNIKALGDRGDGLYEFEATCDVCKYSDTFLSDDPNDPQL